jgi:hypothetical protein
VNVVWSVVQLVSAPSGGQVIAGLVAVALVLAALFARVFAQKVQDRVIRLEMRLRLATVLPSDQRGQIDALSTAQLIGLRFASDAELPGLVRTVLDGRMENKNAIKRLVKNWVGDHDVTRDRRSCGVSGLTRLIQVSRSVRRASLQASEVARLR